MKRVIKSNEDRKLNEGSLDTMLHDLAQATGKLSENQIYNFLGNTDDGQVRHLFKLLNRICDYADMDYYEAYQTDEESKAYIDRIINIVRRYTMCQ